MPCEITKIKDGMIITCGRGARGKCFYCSRPGTKLCDFPEPESPTSPGGTCDRRLCGQCARRDGELDFCRLHPVKSPSQGCRT